MQYVQGFSALVSGAVMLAYTLPQSVWGVGAGFFVSKTNRYKLVIVSMSLIMSRHEHSEAYQIYVRSLELLCGRWDWPCRFCGPLPLHWER